MHEPPGAQTLEVSIDSTRRALARRPPLIVLAAFGVLAFLLILALGGPTIARGLDPAWTEVLAWSFLHRLQWGRDLVFTYGPLGFLQPYSSYVRGIWPWFTAGQIILPAAFALVAVVLLRRCTLGQFLLFALAYVCWCSNLAGDITWALTLLFTTTCLVDRRADSAAGFYALAALLAPVFAVIALAKFSLFPLWLVCVGAVVVNCVLQRQLLRAAATFAIFAIALLAVWSACGQQLGNLPWFLLRGFQLSAGYGSAMGNDAPLLYEALALLLCAVLFAVCARGLWQARSDRGNAIVAILVAITGFLFWLACFTRGDHWPWFFPAFALIPFALLGSSKLAPDPIVRRGAMLVTLVATLVAFRAVPPSVIVAQLTYRPQSAYANLANLKAIGEQRDQTWASVAVHSNLPKIRAMIGTNRVDLLTWEQGLILVNGFNYAPRPVFQSYAAFTPTLARLNESYFLGVGAPDFVMLRLDFIDQRVPMSEDGLALIALLRRYRPVLSERGFLLLKRDATAPPAQPVSPEPERQVSAKLGADIEFKHGNAATIGFFRIELSPFGKLYTVLFREPVLTLIAKTAHGEIRHRLVRATAASGFLVNPLVESNNDWVKLYFSKPLPEVQALRVEPESRWDRLIFQQDLTVGFQPVESLHADPATVSTQIGALILYPGFDLMPTDGIEFRTIVEDEQESVFLHAPAKMTFKPTPGHYSLTAIYGIQGIAIRDDGCQRSKPDGVGISVVLRHGETETELSHADLDPFHVPREAGPQKLAIPGFDVAAGDIVEYRVDGGPAGNNFGCDWSYVRDMVFARQLQAVGRKPAAPAPEKAGTAGPLRAGFNIAPTTGNLRFIDDEGKESMFLHAPSTVDFQPAPGRYDIAATFGLQGIAVTDPGCVKANADGVGVSVVLRHGGRQSTLRHVEIDPFHVPGDRGPRQLAIASVDISAGDILSYRVDPGHGGSNTSCDWTYVRNFQASPVKAASNAGAVPARKP